MMEYLFYALSTLSIVFALYMVLARNPVHSVLALILTFFAIAGHYILLNAQFLAVVHVIVYAGAIMVLFLFVLMLLNLNTDNEPQKSNMWKILAAISAGLLLVTMVAAMKDSEQVTLRANQILPDQGLVHNLGKLLFTKYVAPFEISSILFLAAMVGAVMVGKRGLQDGPSH
jgi:NADH-quinone oxidoreductase subunit J